MIYIAKNKVIAILVFLFVNAVIYSRGNAEHLEFSLSILGVILVPILFPGIFSFFAGWGFMESLARDSGKGVSPNFVSFFYWLLFIIVSMFVLFKWGLY